jgi:hypothetical protein
LRLDGSRNHKQLLNELALLLRNEISISQPEDERAAIERLIENLPVEIERWLNELAQRALLLG